MDNEKCLMGSVVFDCEDCGTSNSVYDFNRKEYKYIHLIKGGIVECRSCGSEHEVDNKMILDYVNN